MLISPSATECPLDFLTDRSACSHLHRRRWSEQAKAALMKDPPMTPRSRILTFCSAVALVLLIPHAALSQQGKKADHNGDPYYLPNCPITGEKLGGMGEPFIKVYDGREVRFCCPKCPAKFEKDLAGNFAKIDDQMI